MYRIEVTPGEETVFRTMEELAVAIRNGVVTPRARIYHNASQKWLPIGLHPHYKKAMELPAASAAHPPTPTPVPPRPRSKPRVESHLVEHRPEPKPALALAPAPKVPVPTVSPVVAMQQEVLRDLPVVAIPEPLPWATRPSPAEPDEPAPTPVAAPVVAIARAVQAQPTAIVTYTPRIEPEPAPSPPEPVEEIQPRLTALRSRRKGGRPLILVGAAAALVAAAGYALNARPFAPAQVSEGARSEEAPSEPVESRPPAEPIARVTPPPPAPATGSPARVTSAPARVRMTPGPAFAASVPAPPGADTIAPRAKAPVAPATPTKAERGETAPSIAPAPVELDLALPDLRTDSIAAAHRGDTLAMKKILRALNGSKP
jgi:hypothetical protein